MALPRPRGREGQRKPPKREGSCPAVPPRACQEGAACLP